MRSQAPVRLFEADRRVRLRTAPEVLPHEELVVSDPEAPALEALPSAAARLARIDLEPPLLRRRSLEHEASDRAQALLAASTVRPCVRALAVADAQVPGNRAPARPPENALELLLPGQLEAVMLDGRRRPLQPALELWPGAPGRVEPGRVRRGDEEPLRPFSVDDRRRETRDGEAMLDESPPRMLGRNRCVEDVVAEAASEVALHRARLAPDRL